MATRRSTTRGFKRTASVLQDRVRKAAESRGFAVSRLLTHWDEIAGADLAAVTRPVKVGYGRGFGATLTLLTTGPQAPMVEMQKETLRQRVNAVYGYNAVARIHLTQTAATGFADGQASFQHRPTAPAPESPSPAVVAQAGAVTGSVTDTGLRDALQSLATKVLTKSTNKL